MDTLQKTHDLMSERGLSLFQLARLSGIPYSTLKNSVARSSQLSVDTIERICTGLQMELPEFFANRSA